MGYNSTQFLSYSDINVKGIDLYEDAWGIFDNYRDVIEVLDMLKPVAGKRITKKLLAALREKR